MYPQRPDYSSIQRRLLALQRGYPIVEGLLLATTGGFVLATTFRKEDSVSRLGAIARTLYLLAEDTCREFDRGELKSVHLSYRRGLGGDDNTPSRVVLMSVGDDAVLLMVLHSAALSPQPLGLGAQFMADIERMIAYITHQITHEEMR